MTREQSDLLRNAIERVLGEPISEATPEKLEAWFQANRDKTVDGLVIRGREDENGAMLWWVEEAV